MFRLSRELPRVELEGYGFGLSSAEGSASPVQTRQEKKAVRASRGHRMGSRAKQELSPEELAKLLNVG